MVIINPAHILKVPLITLQDMFYKTLYHRRTLKKYFLPLSESIHSELQPLSTSAGNFAIHDRLLWLTESSSNGIFRLQCDILNNPARALKICPKHPFCCLPIYI